MDRARVTNNSRGQALLETLIVFPIYATLVIGLMIGVYAALVLHWTDYWAYRATICLAEDKEKWTCRQDLQKKISVVVPNRFFTIQKLNITKRKSQCQVDLQFGRLKIFHLDFGDVLQRSIKSEVPLPLISP